MRSPLATIFSTVIPPSRTERSCERQRVAQWTNPYDERPFRPLTLRNSVDPRPLRNRLPSCYKNSMSRLTIFLVAVSTALATTTSRLHAELQAGTAVVDITPTEFPLMPRGQFFPTALEKVNDPLNVRCIVLQNGETRIAMAVVDSCMVHREQLDPAKKAASEACGIPVENMMISATHTHSAPAPNAQRGTPQEIAYRDKLIAGITEAIVTAAGNIQSAKVGYSGRDLPDEVFNRRWFVQPDAMPKNPFDEIDIVKMNPSNGLINPAGPTDPEVSVLYLTDAENKPLGVYANYSLHYVGGTGDKFSADYYGEFARRMPARLGSTADGFVAMMSNGTSGDINNINFYGRRPKRADYEQIGIVAGKAADAASDAIRNIQSPTADARLDMRQRAITLKHRVPTEEQIERAKKIVKIDAEGEKKLPRLAKPYAERTLNLAEYPPTTEVLIQTIRIGDLAICSMPFEVFAEIGLNLKEKSPAADTFIVELANGGYGYLPTPNQHKFGGYETWLGTNKVQEDASEILTAQLLEMLDELFK